MHPWVDALIVASFAVLLTTFAGLATSCGSAGDSPPEPPSATFFREPRSGLCFAVFDTYHRPVLLVPCTPEVLLLSTGGPIANSLPSPIPAPAAARPQ